MLKPIFKQILQGFLIASTRFPVAVACSALLCSLSVASIHSEKVRSLLSDIPFHETLSCWILWALATKLCQESRNHTLRRHYVSLGVGFALITAITMGGSKYFGRFSALGMCFNPGNDFIKPYLLLLVAFTSAVMAAPFLNSSSTNQEIWSFTHQVRQRTLYTFLASMIIFIGLAAVLGSLEYLFSIGISENQYYDLGAAIWLLGFPVLTMAGFPARLDGVTMPSPQRISLKLIEYVLIPLITVYGIILYAYILKILLTWGLPRGHVTLLVFGFGVMGTWVYLLTDTDQEKQTRLTLLFRKHFFSALLAPLMLAGIALYVRIHPYGLTSARYGACLVFIGLLGVSAYALIRGRNQISKITYYGTSVLLIFASFGPWSIVNLPNYSQLHRLETVLTKNKVLVNGEITDQITPLESFEERKVVSSALDYLIGTPELIKPWFAHKPDSVLNDPKKSRIAPDDLAKELGAKYLPLSDREKPERKRFSFSNKAYQQMLLPTYGYDYVTDNVHISYASCSLPLCKKSSSQELVKQELGEELKSIYDPNTSLYRLTHKGKDILSFHLTELVAKLLKEKNPEQALQDWTLEGTSTEFKVRFKIKKLDASTNSPDQQSEELESTWIQGVIYLKKDS